MSTFFTTCGRPKPSSIISQNKYIERSRQQSLRKLFQLWLLTWSSKILSSLIHFPVFILSNLDWPGLTLPPDIAGAYSTHICHANLTQGSLTYTSCESSGFRHLYEILHRCDVRSLYGRSWLSLLAPSGALVVIMVYYIHTYIHTTQFFRFFKFFRF